MSVLIFPDLETLQLALTSGAVPPLVSMTPVLAGSHAEARVQVKPSAPRPRNAQADLRRLGVQAAKALTVAAAAELSCWAQLIPLRREESPAVPAGQTPVLFELPRPEGLPALVGEMLRLG